jgi:N utilization substance protein B
MKTSKDPRHQARRLAFAVVHALVNSAESHFEDKLQEVKESSLDSLKIDIIDKELYESIVQGVIANKDSLIKQIEHYCTEWPIDKLYRTDLNVLMVAFYEITQKKAPLKVIIDEAVELAKEFGEEDSPKFVNGVLAGIANDESRIA